MHLHNKIYDIIKITLLKIAGKINYLWIHFNKKLKQN